ncbi:cytochrome c [Reinekea marina]|uniref:C-type cytochrome n=1 Tax=Reinekea marina TaxID=1310421 RepID=A0ABV7WSX7_9GAMM|nr:cytochrome c [Reinekea marina]MDN3648827.1 cytochrome c [Reinekea marina]
MNRLVSTTMSIIVSSAFVTGALAHDGATGVVKQRMDAMSAIGNANKSLSNIARGRADFDLDTVTSAAASIAEHSQASALEFFVEGTEGGVSDAKAEIWQDWEKFSGLMTDLNRAAVSLSQISAQDEFAAAYKDVTATCGSCHKAFRAK